MTLQLHQYPGQTRHVGDVLLIDGDPWAITATKPQRELGVFIDYGSVVEARVVVVTVERVQDGA